MIALRRALALFALILSLNTGAAVVAADTTNSIPKELRAAKVTCDKATIDIALELKRAGWTYIMPEPKSPQAAWGNRDGRTTWWIGYWVNKNTDSTSATQPARDADGKLSGDGKGSRSWRRGGSPPSPTKVEWLCSDFGGIAPH